jgi:hypothetical protein
MMRPICVPCGRFFEIEKNGQAFTETFPVTVLAPDGSGAKTEHRPYRIWNGDLYECRGCHAVIITGTGSRPVAERHDEDFEFRRAAIGADAINVKG